MDFKPRALRADRAPAAAAAVGSAILLALIGAKDVVGQVRILPGLAGDAEQFSPSGVYLPNDRALNRAMERARERVADGEYQQALNFLQQVLSREEDSFLDESPEATARMGLKASARQMIGELPPAGRDAFELLYGAAARRQLEAAVAAGDRPGVAQVVRQYFHTSAGYEAALVLAQMESDAGHHLAAAQLYQELLDSPRAVALLDPQLSFLATVNHWAAGRAAESAATFKSLIGRDPNGAVELSGRNVPLPGSQSDLSAWLSERAGNPEQLTRAERDWATLHGNAARNAQHAGGAPHLRTRWQARVVNDPNLEEFLSSRARQFAERGIVVLPAARPIAVGDVVLMRTPSNVVAIDWQTGKRVWETREEEGLSTDDLLPTLTAVEGGQEATTTASILELRLWDDALSMSLSSDGERAYVIRGANVTPEEADLELRLRMLGGLRGTTFPTTNQLAAFELATEGKLVWELDGARAAGPLAGAFFLGAPLAVDNTLYVLAEIRFAIYLLAIDPKNGRVQWQQQLVGLEQGISLDTRRRMAGSTPSYAGGMLICPTAAGATIAVDVVRRELAWVYEYSRDALSRAEMQMMLQQQLQNQTIRGNNQWLDNSAVIDDGLVFLTPPESQELHCVDLRSGAAPWKRPQGDALFIGCVDNGVVLLIGSRAIEAVRAVDGAAAWQDRTIPLPEGTRPAGQGYLSEGRYHLPLSNGMVLATDVAEGKQVGLAEGEIGAPLGNLICTRGSVISQSPLVMDKFEQLEVLRQRAEAALAINGEDPSALRELAEMNRAAGKLADAIALLKRAHALAPDDLLARETLAEYLLVALSEDYAATRSELPLLRSLIAGQRQELGLLRIEARGLEKMGQPLAAWDAYLRAADAEAGQLSDLEMDANHSVRSDRWLAGRLDELWSAASSEEQAMITSRAEAAIAALGRQPSSDGLQQFLERYGALPIAEAIRLQLAGRLVASQQMDAAEIELLKLMSSPAEEVQAAAAALLAKSLIDSGKPDAAATFARRLLDEWPSLRTIDDLSGQQWVQRLVAESPALGTRLSGHWPRGQVTARVESSPGPAMPMASVIRAEQQTTLRKLRIEQEYSAGFQTEHWFISADGPQLLGRSRDGRDFAMLAIDPGGRPRRNSDVPYAHAARLGSLLYVSFGGRVMAIDSRQLAESGQALWEANALGRFPVAMAQSSRGRSARRQRVYDPRSARQRDLNVQTASALGPVTPYGVVFLEQNALKCVDPLNGNTLWTRSDIPRGCELFGDDEFVFAIDTAERVVHIIQMTDGTLVDRRPMPALPWLLTAGRNVARSSAVRGAANSLSLTVLDIVSGDKLFDANYHSGSTLTVVEPNLIAVYEPTGKFQLVDIKSGSVLVDQQLEPYPRAQNIQVDISGDALILAISSDVRPGKHLTVGMATDYPLIDGLVYAFDLKSGQPMWPAPAVVNERGLVLVGPHDLPFVVFADRETRRDAGSGTMKLRLLCLDKRTGQSVYRNDDMLDAPDGHFRIQSEIAAQDLSADPRRVITIDTTSQQVELTVTDKPRPPEPPARDELVADREIEVRGIRGALQRATDALQQSQQQNQSETNRRGRGRRGGQ